MSHPSMANSQGLGAVTAMTSLRDIHCTTPSLIPVALTSVKAFLDEIRLTAEIHKACPGDKVNKGLYDGN